MQFEQLITIIEQTSRGLQKKALTSVNQLLVIRNWQVGFYLVQFEQKGEDRAKYGEKLLETIAEELKKKKLKGLSKTNLKIFRQFYETYPQIGQAVPEESIRSIGQPLADQFSAEKGQALLHSELSWSTPFFKFYPRPLGITKRDGEDYDDYVNRSMSNSIAQKVKIADLEDNIDIKRLDILKEEDLKRLNKYLRAWKSMTKEGN